jgi:hypothetical protein
MAITDSYYYKYNKTFIVYMIMHAISFALNYATGKDKWVYLFCIILIDWRICNAIDKSDVNAKENLIKLELEIVGLKKKISELEGKTLLKS